MVIIWGKKIRRELAGYYLDYCSTCRMPEVHEVTDVFQVDHLYYIPLGSGTFAGREIACVTCQTTDTRATKGDLPLMASRNDRKLMLEAVPADIRESWDKAIEREQEVRSNPNVMTPEERIGRILDVFKGYESKAQQAIGGQLNLEPRMGLMVLIWFMIFLPIAFLIHVLMKIDALRLWVENASGDSVGVTIIAGMLVLGGVIIYYLRTYKGVYLKAHVETPLAATLAPMKPTRQEIAQVVALIKPAKYITSQIDQARMQELLARAQRA